MRVLDLSQDFSMHTPAFASYTGPSIKWVKRLAFDKAGGQEITSTLHVSTHLDAPAHFFSGGKFIGDLPLQWLVGTACVVDLERMGVGDYDLFGPEHFERWEKDTGLRIERDEILVIHTGYHRYYPENWADGRADVDETKYFIRHPGPTRAFAEWVLERGIRWLAVDAGSADHPMNTVIRRIRGDEAEDAEAKLGRTLDEIFPKRDYQVMHTLLFPHDVIHIENLGGDIDKVLDRKIQFGCFPWRFQGGEAAFCRAVAFLDDRRQLKPAPFEYHSPASVAEAVSLLGSLEDAKVLAGGQSLIPLLNFRLARPANLVDINRLDELSRVYERDGGLAVGAAVRQADLESHPLAASRCPLLPLALRLVAHPVIRNRGTVCGSLAHADPAAELCATLLALDGRVIARSVRGQREIAAEDLFRGPMDSALAADELLTEAWFGASEGPVAIAEEARRHGDFAMAGAVRSGDRLVLFGVATRPVLADPADPTRGLEPSADPECSPAFRLHLVEAMVERVMSA